MENNHTLKISMQNHLTKWQNVHVGWQVDDALLEKLVDGGEGGVEPPWGQDSKRRRDEEV